MARVRHYFSYDEALAEWRRFGLPETFIDRRKLMGSIIVIEDDIDLERAEAMVQAVKRNGGEAHICRRTKRPKVVAVGAPGIYEQMAMGSGADMDLLSGLLDAIRNYHSEFTLSVPYGRKEMRFDRPLVMGILNLTPDSFSDGGQYFDTDQAVAHAKFMVANGADIIDIGAESTRPGSNEVDPEIELERLLPVLKELVPFIKVPISVDTRHASVAKEALASGASIINDISGLRDDLMLKLLADARVPVVAMHMRGEPRSMQQDVRYEDLVGDIYTELSHIISRAKAAGIKEEKIILDPGLGFGKEAEQNLELLRRLKEFRCLGRPLLIGASRKRFIGHVTGGDPKDRLEGSLAAAMIAVQNGASIVRVHDVPETVKVLKLWKAVQTVNVRPY
ncbi:MAG: dihydropteroate synthase [Methanomassiliicoccales archaeon PtaU1.Bin124]|nr:MAG: dihydropteroate synthase [Methanomassiliicoccales archaeon PtaU1.Bin124]